MSESGKDTTFSEYARISDTGVAFSESDKTVTFLLVL